MQTHRKPSAYVMQHEGQGQGINSRESGTVVGGEWEDHMHFTRHWWKLMLMHLITVLSHEKEKKTPKKQYIHSSLIFPGFLIQTHTYSKSFTGFRWYTPTGIVILPQNHWWFKKNLKKTELVEKADTVPSSGGGGNCLEMRRWSGSSQSSNRMSFSFNFPFL